ncbi:MAG: hypothetical protein IJV82_06140 [Oscillospiraceae bacterium]|nr:hypothetical protein [Oscillospiraceae bacterium]
MKKLLALLLTLTVLVSLAACGKEKNENPEPQTEATNAPQTDPSGTQTDPSGTQTDPTDGPQEEQTNRFDLISSVVKYDGNGVPVQKVTYTYNDKGLLLKKERDNGISQEVWNEDAGLFEFVCGPFDGKPEWVYECIYTAQGDLEASKETSTTYDENGQVKKTSVYDTTGSSTYYYDENGRIKCVEQHPYLLVGGFGTEIACIARYIYDGEGRLIEIHNEAIEDYANDQLCFDFRYDSEGRLIGCTNRPKEGLKYYQMSYNADGQLAEVTLSGGPTQKPIDDLNTIDPSFAMEGAIVLSKKASFKYDGQGRLLYRYIYDSQGNEIGRTACTYTGDKLTAVEYGDERYVYTDTDAFVEGSQYTLVQDASGKVVKILKADGSYQVIAYTAVELEDADVTRFRNNQQSIDRMDPMGSKSYFIGLCVGQDYTGYRSVVEMPLFDVDTLRQIAKSDLF